MTEQRLIDANLLLKEAEESLCENPHTGVMAQAMHAHEHRHFMCMILHQTTIDPESLPIVQELRAELARVTAERDKIAQYELDACDEYCFGDSSTGIHECEWLDSNDRCKLKEWAEGRGTKGD